MSEQSTGEVKILLFFASLVICAGGLLYRLTYDVATDQLQRHNAAKCIHVALSESRDCSVSGNSVSAQVKGDRQSPDPHRELHAASPR